MKSLGRSVWSQHSEDGGERYSNAMIRLSQPLVVESYPDLVRTVAEIQYGNPEYSLFFRGQYKDHTLPSGSTTMYPSIYRSPKEPLSADELEARMKKLARAEVLLMDKFKQNNLEGHLKLSKFRELCWAILQHYEVCKTPLLDITSSLHAAASFAVKTKSATGILYVLGFPHINGSISYYVEEELLNIKLLSICPPEAQRPYFQEGFLVGTFPSEVSQKQASLDVACRLIAKFEIGGPKFWIKRYAPIPKDFLFPGGDVVKTICDDIKIEINNPPAQNSQATTISENNTDNSATAS